MRKSVRWQLALLVAAGLLATASPASAGRHGWGYGSLGGFGGWARPYSGWASYGSLGYTGVGYGGYGSYGSFGSFGGVGYGSCGSLGGLFAHKHYRRAWRHGGLAYASMGSYGGGWGYNGYGGYASTGSYGSYGSVGYSLGSCGSSGGVYSGYGSYGSYGSVGGAVGASSYPADGAVLDDGSMQGGMREGAPPEPPMTNPPADSDGTTPPPPPEGDAAQSGSGSATLLTVTLPEDAQLYVNGYRMRSTGPVRVFRSNQLAAGERYAYELRAVVQRDGRLMTESKSIQLVGGAEQTVAFPFDASSPVRTTLTLTVPDDAQVELGGVATQTEGAVRTYTTTRLEPGQVWDNYTVRVSVEQDGRTVAQERTIELVGGERHELAFQFDRPMAVAAAH